MPPAPQKVGDATLRTPSPETVDELRAQLRGSLCLPGEPGYEQSRTIWNAMIDRRRAGAGSPMEWRYEPSVGMANRAFA